MGVVARIRTHFTGRLPIQIVARAAMAQGLEVDVAVEVQVERETDQPGLFSGMSGDESRLDAVLIQGAAMLEHIVLGL